MNTINFKKIEQLLTSSQMEDIELAFQLVPKSENLPQKLKQNLLLYPAYCFKYDWMNLYQEFPEIAEKFDYLKLEDVSFEVLEQNLSLFKNLETLILSANDLEDLPNSLGKQAKIKHLNLSFNKFKRFPKALDELSNLEVLDLSSNFLEEVPMDIHKFKNLKELDLRDNLLTSLPNEIILLEQLESLLLADNQFQEVPTKIYEMESLVHFDLENDSINSKEEYTSQNLLMLKWMISIFLLK